MENQDRESRYLLDINTKPNYVRLQQNASEDNRLDIFQMTGVIIMKKT